MGEKVGFEARNRVGERPVEGGEKWRGKEAGVNLRISEASGAKQRAEDGGAVLGDVLVLVGNLAQPVGQKFQQRPQEGVVGRGDDELATGTELSGAGIEARYSHGGGDVLNQFHDRHHVE